MRAACVHQRAMLAKFSQLDGWNGISRGGDSMAFGVNLLS